MGKTIEVVSWLGVALDFNGSEWKMRGEEKMRERENERVMKEIVMSGWGVDGFC